MSRKQRRERDAHLRVAKKLLTQITWHLGKAVDTLDTKDAKIEAFKFITEGWIKSLNLLDRLNVYSLASTSNKLAYPTSPMEKGGGVHKDVKT